MSDEGGGVVVIHVPRSFAAPHRETFENRSYIRRGEDSIPMTMREVHDKVRIVDRGMDSLEI